jgi:hypothetical protein
LNEGIECVTENLRVEKGKKEKEKEKKTYSICNAVEREMK